MIVRINGKVDYLNELSVMEDQKFEVVKKISIVGVAMLVVSVIAIELFPEYEDAVSKLLPVNSILTPISNPIPVIFK